LAVGRDYEPVKGQWYENVEELVEIEYLDGDIEELDIDAWHEMDLQRIAEPEGWAASEAAAVDKEDEEEEEEDLDDDWDDDEDEDDDDEDWDEDEDEDDGR
jgi:hypothetical protein